MSQQKINFPRFPKTHHKFSASSCTSDRNEYRCGTELRGNSLANRSNDINLGSVLPQGIRLLTLTASEACEHGLRKSRFFLAELTKCTQTWIRDSAWLGCGKNSKLRSAVGVLDLNLHKTWKVLEMSDSETCSCRKGSGSSVSIWDHGKRCETTKWAFRCPKQSSNLGIRGWGPLSASTNVESKGLFLAEQWNDFFLLACCALKISYSRICIIFPRLKSWIRTEHRQGTWCRHICEFPIIMVLTWAWWNLQDQGESCSADPRDVVTSFAIGTCTNQPALLDSNLRVVPAVSPHPSASKIPHRMKCFGNYGQDTRSGHQQWNFIGFRFLI